MFADRSYVVIVFAADRTTLCTEPRTRGKNNRPNNRCNRTASGLKVFSHFGDLFVLLLAQIWRIVLNVDKTPLNYAPGKLP